jgi:hypothetical protein
VNKMNGWWHNWIFFFNVHGIKLDICDFDTLCTKKKKNSKGNSGYLIAKFEKRF